MCVKHLIPLKVIKTHFHFECHYNCQTFFYTNNFLNLNKLIN